MTKFILVLYSCSFMTMQCGSGMYLTKHDTWYECAKDGYVQAQKLMELADVNKVNAGKLAIKFECQPIEIVLPKPKPKV
jgi:ribosomal protein S27AE